MIVALEPSPASDARSRLERALMAYNAQASGIDDAQFLVVTARDEAGNLRGGLHGYTWLQHLEVKVVWVAEELRGQGYGRRILGLAEEEARRRGCHTVLLETMSFQAPEFYRKLGYEAFAVLDSYASGWTRHCFRKRL